MFDPKLKQKRAEYSQNFLKNPSLGRYLIGLANFKPGETVLEIGPGQGVLTDSLLAKGLKVVAIEKDPELINELKIKFKDSENLKLIEADILKHKIQNQNYKIFANPPFAISSQLVKKLVFDSNIPAEIYLFLQKEFASRIIAKHFNTQLSVLVKGLYKLQIIHEFKPEDFSPVPAVEVVLVKFELNKNLKIDKTNLAEFIAFVSYGFAQQKSYLEKNLEKIYTHEQWKKLSKGLNFELKSQPGDLDEKQWVGLFEAFMSPLVSGEKRKIIL